MTKAEFHTAIDSFGDGFGHVMVQPSNDYATGDRWEIVSADIGGFDLCDGEKNSVLLDDFIGMLVASRGRIPEEFRTTAFIDMDCYGEYAHASLRVGYKVDEPERAKVKRRAAEKEAADARAALNAEKSEQRERAEFERLKAKFEK